MPAIEDRYSTPTSYILSAGRNRVRLFRRYPFDTLANPHCPRSILRTDFEATLAPETTVIEAQSRNRLQQCAISAVSVLGRSAEEVHPEITEAGSISYHRTTFRTYLGRIAGNLHEAMHRLFQEDPGVFGRAFKRLDLPSAIRPRSRSTPTIRPSIDRSSGGPTA